MITNKELSNNNTKQEARFSAWLLVKFGILFGFVTAFVTYNFNSPIAGFLLATAITGLSLAHSRIFDAASNSFLDI
jgi:hypothetical protein